VTAPRLLAPAAGRSERDNERVRRRNGPPAWFNLTPLPWQTERDRRAGHGIADC
jgi:hypothetical protein